MFDLTLIINSIKKQSAVTLLSVVVQGSSARYTLYRFARFFLSKSL
jgi:hypothetical protein